jgi:hypothetical protein
MFLGDIIREQLPRNLQRLNIVIMPHYSWEQATVTFEIDGQSLELEDVDPAAGLTDTQLARLCVTF